MRFGNLKFYLYRLVRVKMVMGKAIVFLNTCFMENLPRKQLCLDGQKNIKKFTKNIGSLEK